MSSPAVEAPSIEEVVTRIDAESVRAANGVAAAEAAAASAESAASSARTVGMVGIVLGAIGIIVAIGALVAADDVEVVLDLRGGRIVDAASTALTADKGHVLLVLDGTLVR